MIGRERERALLLRHLSEGARLVTVWGPPGIGKTRLVRESLPEVPPVALGPGAELGAALEGRRGPVAVDGVEQAADAAEAVARWLAQDARNQAILTSRRRLRVPAELALPLGPLDEGEGVRLFVAAAARARPGWDPDPEERRRLEELVRRLEGNPLALELAAARWELLGTEALLQRVSRPLAVLARPRAATPRHATLRAAVASSWELLTPEEQEAMNACATFAGPFDVAAAEAVIGPSALERLESLVDAAMVQVPSPGRFALLGFVADFVREGISSAERARWGDRHVAWLLSQVPDVDVGRVPSELHPDLVAGATFLVERGDPRAEALLLAVTVARPGRHAELLEEAVRRFGSPAAMRARARWRRLTGDAEGALRDLDEALRGSTDPRGRGRLLRELGVLHHARRDELAARRCYEEALALHRAAGDRRDEAVTTGNLGALDHDLCRYEEAEVHYEAALAGLRAAGDRRAEATFLANLAVLRQEQGDPRGAASGYSRALGLLEEAGDDRMVAITLGNIGLLQHELGELDAALGSHQRAAERFGAVDDPASEALCRARLGAVACLLGLPAGPEELDRAERLAGISGDETTARVVGLLRAFEALAAGRASEVRRRLEDARGLVDRSQDARVAARLLAAGIREEEVLVVGPDWFVAPGGSRGELARYQSCLRMFEVLVERRLADPDGVLEIEELFGAGWPGERISAASMRNRVHVNLARLRTLGLKAVLIRSGEGYRLDPAVRVEDRRGS